MSAATEPPCCTRYLGAEVADEEGADGGLLVVVLDVDVDDVNGRVVLRLSALEHCGHGPVGQRTGSQYQQTRRTPPMASAQWPEPKYAKKTTETLGMVRCTRLNSHNKMRVQIHL